MIVYDFWSPTWPSLVIVTENHQSYHGPGVEIQSKENIWLLLHYTG